MGFTGHFTGLPIEPATVSYQLFILTADITLNWATSFVDPQTTQPNTVAGQNDVNANADWIIKLPDATQVSVGQQMIFTNIGALPFHIIDNGGGASLTLTIASGIEWRLYLTDNSTAAGVWRTTQFGAGTSAAQASQLTGLGLSTQNTVLNTNIPPRSIAANYQLVATDLASLLVCTGGTVTFTMPASGASAGGYTVGLGWYVSFNNAGTGVLTVQGNGLNIDGENPITLVPGQSAYIVLTNQGWNSIGRGTPTFFTDNPIVLNLSGGSVTLSQTQQQNNLITFDGALPSNTIVTFQSGVAGSWYIYNQTTGPYSLSIIVNGSTLPAVTLPPNNSQTISYSDGINMYQTPTVVAPSTFTFANGSAGTPSMTFTGSLNSGFYLVNAANVGFSSSAVQSMQFGPQLQVTGGTALAPAYTFLGAPNTGIFSTDVSELGFTVNGNTLGQFLDNDFLLQTPLAPPSGGTGTSNWTVSNGLIAAGIGNAPFQPVPVGSAGQLLKSTGGVAVPAWTTATYPSSITNNQMLVGNISNNVVAISSIPTALSSTITTLNTITSGAWNAGIIAGQYGGTGVANTGKTITLGGNVTTTGALTTAGANALTLTTTATTNVTLPPITSGTLGWVKLSSQTASNSASINFTNVISSSYVSYMLVIANLLTSASTSSILLRVSINNGASYDSGNNYSWNNFISDTGGTSSNGAALTSSITLMLTDGSNRGPNSTLPAGGMTTIYNPTASSQMLLDGLWSTINTNGTKALVSGRTSGAWLTSSGAVNAFQLTASTGLIASGTFTLYGMVA